MKSKNGKATFPKGLKSTPDRRKNPPIPIWQKPQLPVPQKERVMNLFEDMITQAQDSKHKLVYKSKNLSTSHYEFEYSSGDLKECEFAAQSACNSIDPMRGPHWEYEGFHGGMHICRLTYWGVD